MKTFSRVLMVDPEHFRVEYAINPYMRDKNGNLNKVSPSLARAQWQNLKSIYQNLGLQVDVILGHKSLPDMVFAANQSFPFWRDQDDRPSVILSQMRSPQRMGEVEYFQKVYKKLDYNIVNLETKGAFEGNGDALYHPLREVIFGGFGPRTDQSVYKEISMRTGLRVLPLQLVNENFYHLDTCFTILNRTTVGVVKEAFTEDGLKSIENEFAKIIFINKSEALEFFAGNAHGVDDQNVILHPGAKKFERDIKKIGLTPICTDTSEFIKSGGSVFCLKMMCW